MPGNRIRELPVALADMGALQVLKLEGNPIRFPPGEEPDAGAGEADVTAHIKALLRRQADGPGDGGGETARPPARRGALGRFPVRVNDGAPPHARLLSQQAAPRPPSVVAGDGPRSKSESLLHPGWVGQRHHLDVDGPRRRLSGHQRGLSHGSAVRVPSPTAPTRPSLQRPVFVSRLSVLPERRGEAAAALEGADAVVEAARGILYAVVQVHPAIQALLLARDGPGRRSSLEIVLYNASSHVEQLEREVQRHDAAAQRGEPGAAHSEGARRACRALVGAYGHVCALLARNTDTLVDGGDARCVRSLLTLLYGSSTELRATLAAPAAAPRAKTLTVRVVAPREPPWPGEDAQLDAICTSLQAAAAAALQALPGFRARLAEGFARTPLRLQRDLGRLVDECDGVVAWAEAVMERLPAMRRADGLARARPAFWEASLRLVESWTGFVELMAASDAGALPHGTRALLRPVQQRIKETSSAIAASPWQRLFRLPASLPTPTPITPQSAALGPASQAAVGVATPRHGVEALGAGGGWWR